MLRPEGVEMPRPTQILTKDMMRERETGRTLGAAYSTPCSKRVLLSATAITATHSCEYTNSWCGAAYAASSFTKSGDPGVCNQQGLVLSVDLDYGRIITHARSVTVSRGDGTKEKRKLICEGPITAYRAPVDRPTSDHTNRNC